MKHHPYGIVRHEQELPAPTGRLYVFDFDDTLVHTNSHVFVIHDDETVSKLTSGEFAVYKRRPGDVFDFSDFNNIVQPRQIMWIVNIMRRVYAKHGSAGMVILSARSTHKPIRSFLGDIGMPNVFVVALNDTDPEKKAAYIRYRILDDDLDHVEFFDDSIKNIEAVRQLADEHPDVEIVTRHVRYEGDR